MYYLCADDSTILSSWPKYPTQYFHSSISQTCETQQVPKLWALDLFLIQCFLFPGIEQPITQVLTLETLDSFSTQLSFPLLVNHQFLHIQPLNCIRFIPFDIPTATVLIQNTTVSPQTIANSPTPVTQLLHLLSICHKSSNQSFLLWKSDIHLLKSFSVSPIKSRICSGNYQALPFFIHSTNVYWEWLCQALPNHQL